MSKASRLCFDTPVNMESEFINFIKHNIDEGQDQLADTIKTLLYRTSPALFDLLSFYDEETFLEPQLFAYFTLKQPQIKLMQIVFGYIKNDLKPEIISVFADEGGVIEMPNIGYFVTDATNRELTLYWNSGPETCVFKDGDNTVAYKFNDIIRVAGTPIQVCQFNNPLLERFYMNEVGEAVSIEVARITRKHLRHLDTALEIIKSVNTHCYEDILKVTRKVLVFKGQQPNSFATISAHGTAFLNADEEHDEVFFIEDLIHQCGHVMFSALTLDKKEFLKLDADTPLNVFTGNDRETRTVYSAFHGIFTEALMSLCLNSCYEKEVFVGSRRHELLGRLAYILKRFNCDLRDIGHFEMFTEKGRMLYCWLAQIFNDISRRRMDILLKLDTSNQPYNFSYVKFLELNPLDKV